MFTDLKAGTIMKEYSRYNWIHIDLLLQIDYGFNQLVHIEILYFVVSLRHSGAPWCRETEMYL